MTSDCGDLNDDIPVDVVEHTFTNADGNTHDCECPVNADHKAT